MARAASAAVAALLARAAPAAAACPVSGRSGAGPCPASAGRGGAGRGAAAGPDPGQRTFEGCACATACAASVTDLYNCDWCNTAAACGREGLAGRHYDYCAYPANASRDAAGFAEKLDELWGAVSADPARGDYPSPLSLLTESVQTSFDNLRDTLPSGRRKGIHGVGVVCRFTLDVAADSPYSGLFAPGPQRGLVRMGSAVDPVANGGMTPGIGVKYPRTGGRSGDYVGLRALDLGQTWNFFSLNLSNHIPGPPPGDLTTGVLLRKFAQASQCPTQVGLSDMARVSQSGAAADHPRFPFKLFHVPGAAVQTPAVNKTVDEVNAEMAGFPVGTTLYTVYACGAPGAHEDAPADGGLAAACAEPLRLGEMVTTSRCVTSGFGDRELFFRHQRIEEDWRLRPDWLEQYDPRVPCALSAPPTITPPNPCPVR